MKLNGIQRSAVAIAAYLAVFTGLVFLQFSRDLRFSDRAGSIDISGIRRLQGGAPSRGFPDEFRLSFSGMVFQFGAGNPIATRNADGSSAALLPSDWQKEGGSVKVSFERSVSLLFAAAPDGSTFSVTAQAADPALAAVVLPFRLSSATFDERKGEGITLRGKAASYTLDASGGTLLEVENHSMLIPLGNGAFSLALKAAAPKPAAAPAAPSLAKLSPMDSSDFASRISAWKDKAWAGLSQGRYSESQKGWKAGDSVSFTESAFMAFIASAMERGAADRYADRISSLREANASRLTWRSDPYFGGIARKTQPLFDQNQASSADLKAKVEAKDASLFSRPDLVTFLLDRASADLEQAVFAYAGSLDASQLAPGDAASLASCMAEAEPYFPGVTNPFRAAASLIEKTILASVQINGNDAYFAPAGSTADVAQQLRLGKALVSWGQAQNSPRVEALGQRLEVSALALADEYGVLPASVAVSGGTAGARSGSLLPEDLFPLVGDCPWYPREITLYRKLGQGAWIWTAATQVDLSSTPSQTVFSVRYPAGSTHYLTAFGIKPFDLIKLYDIPYHADDEFESYNASGYLYSRSTWTLYVKMKHKKDSELIELDY